MHEHFDRPFGLPEPDMTERYFHEFYEQRVMTLHPASRYGDVPYSPIMHDDIPHLRSSLREIFAYIVLGSHGSDYFEDVRWHKKVTLVAFHSRAYSGIPPFMVASDTEGIATRNDAQVFP